MACCSKLEYIRLGNRRVIVENNIIMDRIWAAILLEEAYPDADIYL
jgi:hypothetical protein